MASGARLPATLFSSLERYAGEYRPSYFLAVESGEAEDLIVGFPFSVNKK